MILADKIIEERKRCGWSQEELANKLSVSRQSVSKWESAQSIPDLQRIIQLAQLFGVSTDYLLKDDIEVSECAMPADPCDDETPLRRVTLEEANEFIAHKQYGSRLMSRSVALCILSPVVLILLAGMAEEGIAGITEQLASIVGISVLLICVAIAVYSFITYGVSSKRFEYLDSEGFETVYGVSGMVKERQRTYEPVFSRGVALGVILCILSPLPLLLGSLAGAPDWIACALVSLLLVIVTVGVYILVRVGMVKGSYDALLQEGDFTQAEKRDSKRLAPVAGVYWCLATAVYLGWSFATNDWQHTWIVWPVAGVLFAAVAGIARMAVKSSK